MATRKELAEGLAAIRGMLSSSPPDVRQALRLVEGLASRQAVNQRVFRNDELIEAVRHIAFETQHFRCYNNVRRDNPNISSSHPTFSQAMGYALLLHLRVLIDFFYKPPADDDCHAASFNVVPGFEDKFPPHIHVQTPRSIEVSKALNKLLAHFTATRWEKPRPAWDFYDEFAPMIDELITCFEAALPDHMRDCYVRAYREWERLHPARLS